MIPIVTKELENNGLKGVLSEDKRSLLTQLVEQDVSKRIVAKGKELAARTQHTLQELKIAP